MVNGFADATGAFLPLACTLNASRVLDAAARMLGVDHAGLSALALSAPSGADGLVLVPYLEGERTPNRPDATGALHGLRLGNTTPAHLARAAVEGMLCALADGLDALRDQGVPVPDGAAHRRRRAVRGGAPDRAVGARAGRRGPVAGGVRGRRRRAPGGVGAVRRRASRRAGRRPQGPRSTRPRRRRTSASSTRPCATSPPPGRARIAARPAHGRAGAVRQCAASYACRTSAEMRPRSETSWPF